MEEIEKELITQRNNWSIPYKNIESTLPSALIEKLLCVKCLNLPMKPRICDCGERKSIHCEECGIVKIIEGQKIYFCPSCQDSKPLIPLSEHSFENSCLETITVVCPNVDCGTQCPLPQLLTHLDVCIYRLINCQFCEIEICVSVLTEHYEICNKVKISCPLCGGYETKENMENHVCLKYVTECMKNMEKKIDDIQGELMKMHEENQNLKKAAQRASMKRKEPEGNKSSRVTTKHKSPKTSKRLKTTKTVKVLTQERNMAKRSKAKEETESDIEEGEESAEENIVMDKEFPISRDEEFESNYYASCALDGRIIIWNSDGFKKEFELVCEGEAAALRLYQLRDNHLVSTMNTGEVWIWDLTQKAVIKKIERSENTESRESRESKESSASWGIEQLRTDQVGIASDDHNIYIYEVEEWTLDQVLISHTARVYTLHEQDSTKNRLFSGSEDGKVKLWNYSTGECLHTITGFNASIWGLVTLSEGKMLSVCGNRKFPVQLWNLDTGKITWKFGGDCAGDSYCEIDDVRIAIGGTKNIQYFNVEEQAFEQTITSVHHGVINTMTKLTNNYLISGGSDHNIKISGRRENGAVFVRKGHTDHVNSIIPISL